jgi:hypothetical protein
MSGKLAIEVRRRQLLILLDPVPGERARAASGRRASVSTVGTA